MSRSADPDDHPLAIPGDAWQAWLAAILEATPDVIIAVDTTGAIVTTNFEAERVFGYARHELVGQPVETVIPDMLGAYPQQDRPAFISNPPTRLIAASVHPVGRHKDGREIPVEIGLVALQPSEGISMDSANRDVSWRHQAEQDRANLAAIVEASSDAIIGSTPEGVVTSWNPAAERLYGYSAGEAIGQLLTSLMPADRMGEVEGILNRIQRGETINNLESVRATRDGQRVHVALTISPVWARDGSVTGVATVARDITDRKAAEAALREVEQRFRSAFDAATIGMALVGLDGRFFQVNQSLCQILGYPEDALLETTFQDITHPDDLQADLDLIRQLLNGEIPNFSMEKRYIHRDGHLVWIQLSVSLVRGDDGAPRYFVSQIQDVTRAREAERLKDEFVSTVSHELRTPLTSISGYVDLLIDGAEGDLPEEGRRYLSIVQQNNARLAALVDDLLDMSRIDAGGIDLRREEIDLAVLLRDVVASFAPEVTAKGQALRLEVPVSLPPIWADAQRTTQIFTNLIANAHKYTPRGGAIAVSGRVEADAVRIDVTDTGIGVSAEDQALLFTRFFRAGDWEARNERGTGLGLAITRALVELHGGTITVHSSPGEGSTFSVLLPARTHSAANPASAQETGTPRGVSGPAQ